MSVLKRMLSSVGIGAAQVDTLVSGTRFSPGDTLNAVVHISGGDLEQRIEGIYGFLQCRYEVETDQGKATQTALLERFQLAEALTIAPGERRDIPVAFQLPFDTPLTLGRTRVWLETGLAIPRALDPSDTDYLEVVPGPLVRALFNALEQLGFRLVQAECEAVAVPFGRFRRSFVQEFEFKPYTGPFRGQLDEVEIVCSPGPDQVEVRLEIDRKARGLGSLLAELANRDETRLRVTFGVQDLPELRERLYQAIARGA